MNQSPQSTISIWKKNFLQNYPMVYAEEALEIAATNRVALRVELSGVELYPTFQLQADRKPYPVIKELLKLADKHQVEDWSVAFWFDTPSSDDVFNRKPVEFIHAPEKLLQAFQNSLTAP